MNRFCGHWHALLSWSSVFVIIVLSSRHIHNTLASLPKLSATPCPDALPHSISDGRNADGQGDPADLLQPIPATTSCVATISVSATKSEPLKG